jgi:hypothetical protein
MCLVVGIWLTPAVLDVVMVEESMDVEGETVGIERE